MHDDPNSADYLLYASTHRNRTIDQVDRRPEGERCLGLDPVASERKPIATKTLPFPLDSKEVRAWEDRLNRLPIIDRLGARFDLSDPHLAKVHIDNLMPYHLGGMGISAVNGSIISGILDCAVGAAAVVHFSGSRAGTLSLTLNFLRPLFGRRALAQCAVKRRTGNLLFVEAYVLDQRGRICSSAVGIAARAASRQTDRGADREIFRAHETEDAA